MLNFRKKYGKNGHYQRMVKRIFGVWAGNIELYKLALVHRSASIVIEDGSSINNERLEFLGDAVLQLLVTEMLFIEYPEVHEGDLTKMRSKIVCRATLNSLARKVALDKEIVSNESNGRQGSRADVHGDAFEALCGAIYLDKGFDAASRAILRLFARNMDIEEVLSNENDHKSRILEWAQQRHKRIEFWCEKAASYSARNPLFECIITLDGARVGYGSSRSKKSAEQKAARDAFKYMEL